MPQRHDTWPSRTVLVTGVGGFIGSGLARALVDQSAAVVGIVRDVTAVDLLDVREIKNRVNIVRGSISEPGVVERALNEYDVSTVFHLAAQSQVKVANRSPVSTFESNIAGTWHVLEAARRVPTVQRVVVASSDKAYGVQKLLPYTEESPLNGRYPYDASKTCTDVLAQCYATTFELPVVILRCANVYGPGDLNWDRLIPGTIRSALRGEAPIVRSDGTPERDYIYLDDAVAAYLRAADALPGEAGEAFNIGSGTPVSVLDLVDRILHAVGAESLTPKVVAEATSEIDRQYLASDKAWARLGWRPLTDIDEGLGKSVAWYRSFLESGTAKAPMLAEVRS